MKIFRSRSLGLLEWYYDTSLTPLGMEVTDWTIHVLKIIVEVQHETTSHWDGAQASHYQL